MRNLITFAFILIICVGFAQNPNRKYLSHNEESGIFQVVTNEGRYIFTPYSNHIIETTFIPKGEVNQPKSHAVVLKPKKLETTYSYVGNVISFSTTGIGVSVTTSPFKISYHYQGKEVVSEKRGYYKSAHVPMDLVKGNIVAKETEKISFNLTSDEVLYGAGARALGMNRRGYRLPLFNRAHYGYETHSELMNYTLPIAISSKMYMIHFDNSPIGYLDFDSKRDNTLIYETISGRKTYQVIAADNWIDLLDEYTDLTGKQPLPPRWALGNFSSRFGYHSQQETEATIEKFKDEQIPVDAVILDLYWFGKEIKGTMGNLAFYKDSFPEPKKMIKNLQSKNVETVLITEPFVLTTSKRWYEALNKNVLAKDSTGKAATYDFYFGNTGIIDIYNETGNRWFKDIYKGLSDLGVNGFWGDLGEPEVHPRWVQHKTGSADEVHNIYGHDWAKLVSEASLESNPNRRPFILMRAGYSGSQRYGLIPWSGDVNRTWGGLQSQPEIALQMGMQGLGYMHSDLGGFAGANLDDELYVRWLQYGVFQPIYRPHAQEDVPSEPVFRSPKTKQLSKQAIELRYKLLPYNYHIAYVNSQSGTPLMRPLFFEEPTKTQLNSISSSYLWGPDLLIAPILQKGKNELEMYFPSTSNWYDFYTDKKVKGGSNLTLKTNEKSIPTFVRGGTFILMAKPIQSTKEYNASDLELHYYFDTDLIESEREFYNDDGETQDSFVKGKYEILEFEAELERNILEIDYESEIGDNWNYNSKEILLVIHNLDWDIKWVKVDGKRIEIDRKDNKLIIPTTWNTKSELKVKVKLK